MAGTKTQEMPERADGSFLSVLGSLRVPQILEAARGATREEALEALGTTPLSLEGAAAVLATPREEILDDLLVRSHAQTESVFHRTLLMFAPCYLSSFCVNGCAYCAYNFHEAPARRWISPPKAGEVIAALAGRGFRRVVLVAGEYPTATTPSYIAESVAEARRSVHEVDLAVGAASESAYRTWRIAGAEGVTCFQETYDRAVYGRVHTSGPKSHFDRRLDTLDRAGRAGMTRLGLGILLGLGDSASDLLFLIAHAQHLRNRFPAARLTVAMPRLASSVTDMGRGGRPVEDEELLRLLAVVRLSLPDAGLVAFPREPEWLRSRMLTAGVTHMTADAGLAHAGAYVECQHDGGVFDVQDPRSDLELKWDLEDMGYMVRRDDAPAAAALAAAPSRPADPTPPRL